MQYAVLNVHKTAVHWFGPLMTGRGAGVVCIIANCYADPMHQLPAIPSIQFLNKGLGAKGHPLLHKAAA